MPVPAGSSFMAGTCSSGAMTCDTLWAGRDAYHTSQRPLVGAVFLRQMRWYGRINVPLLRLRQCVSGLQFLRTSSDARDGCRRVGTRRLILEECGHVTCPAGSTSLLQWLFRCFHASAWPSPSGKPPFVHNVHGATWNQHIFLHGSGQAPC